LLPYFNRQEIKVKVESPKEKEEKTLAKDSRLTKDVKYLSDASIIYCMKKKED
jgi:superfamily II DNA helicase RecQ